MRLWPASRPWSACSPLTMVVRLSVTATARDHGRRAMARKAATLRAKDSSTRIVAQASSPTRCFSDSLQIDNRILRAERTFPPAQQRDFGWPGWLTGYFGLWTEATA